MQENRYEENKALIAPSENNVCKGPDFQSSALIAHQREIAKRRDYYVVQSNDMVQQQRFLTGKGAKKSLTLVEAKIFNYLISQIKPDTKHLEPMVFDIKTFCEVCGLSKGRTDNCYNQIKGAVEHLAGRVMWLTLDNGSETTVRYIERVTMSKRSGKITVEFDRMLEPYLLNLAGNYFQFSYHNLLAMTSKYSIQLYKLLKSYYFRFPCVRFGVEDLKVRLDALHYERFSNFRQKVLMPAIKDINTFSDLQVDVEYEKSGRNISHIIFSMTDLSASKKRDEIIEAGIRYDNTESVLALDEDQYMLLI